MSNGGLRQTSGFLQHRFGSSEASPIPPLSLGAIMREQHAWLDGIAAGALPEAQWGVRADAWLRSLLPGLVGHLSPSVARVVTTELLPRAHELRSCSASDLHGEISKAIAVRGAMLEL